MSADFRPPDTPELPDLPPALQPLAEDPAVRAGLSALVEQAFRAGRVAGNGTEAAHVLRRRERPRHVYRVSVVPTWLDATP